MSRTMETSEFSIPPAFLRKAAKIVREKHLSPPELLNEMLDVYQQHRKQRKPYDEAWAMKVIQEAQEEERLHPMTPEELAQESRELRRYGIAQAKKLGLKAKDIDRLLRQSKLMIKTGKRIVVPRLMLDVIQEDPDDNRILECAVGRKLSPCAMTREQSTSKSMR
jgi:hypothetical protein